jgi:hypothetical protein
VKRSGDIPCPRPMSFKILARVRGCHGARSAPRGVPVARTQRTRGTTILEGHGEKEFG